MAHPIFAELERRHPRLAEACDELFTEDMAFIQMPNDTTYGLGRDLLLNPGLELTLVHASAINNPSGRPVAETVQLLPAEKRPPKEQIVQRYTQSVGCYQEWGAGAQVSGMLNCAQFSNGWASVEDWTLEMLHRNDRMLHSAYILAHDAEGNPADLLAYPRLLFDRLGDLLAREVLVSFDKMEFNDLQSSTQEFRALYADFYQWTGAAAAASTLATPERFAEHIG